ncbi:hypothetical protein [Amycolatopsis sp. MtRt-6]|uniref:hypothetical protein n=1 Tax=Amycolatopsis sp. MtRt-6 TaxID=2792782 RepID=UPI001A8F9641|nr:hypothetical protein [Amycolatopsis sp. MtRt-6]
MTWWVVVEEQRGSERNWALSERVRFADRETAEAEALRLAREHEPAHPWSVKTRTVLRGPGGYLVIAEGRTATFHFRVSVLEEV